jgi:hypothetical protein
MGSAGAVFVSGEVVLASEFSQTLRFEFRTDQTCLRPLARDLQECATMATV